MLKKLIDRYTKWSLVLLLLLTQMASMDLGTSVTIPAQITFLVLFGTAMTFMWVFGLVAGKSIVSRPLVMAVVLCFVTPYVWDDFGYRPYFFFAELFMVAALFARDVRTYSEDDWFQEQFNDIQKGYK